MATIALRDSTGSVRFIDETELYSWVASQDFELYGMGKGTILEFRKQYLRRGGTLPMNPQTVSEIFK